MGITAEFVNALRAFLQLMLCQQYYSLSLYVVYIIGHFFKFITVIEAVHHQSKSLKASQTSESQAKNQPPCTTIFDSRKTSRLNKRQIHSSHAYRITFYKQLDKSNDEIDG